MWYQRVGHDEDETAPSYILTGITNSGTDIHVRVQTAVAQMKENGIDCEYVNVADFVKQRELTDLEIVSQNGMETKLFNTRWSMSFLCDGIIRYKGRYYILELKTESANKFYNRRGVDPKHYNQATAYSLAFNLNDVIFVYISRDILDMKAFMLTVTDDMKMDVIGRIEECETYVHENKVPPMPDDASPKLCQYCSYRGACKIDG